jgi:hypothetical protein
MHATTHGLTRRVATISAIGSLFMLAFAATASARPCSCGDPAQEARITRTWIQAQRQLRHVGREAAPASWSVPSGFDALNLLLAEGNFYPAMGWL